MGDLSDSFPTLKSEVRKGGEVGVRPHHPHLPPPLRPVGARGVGEVGNALKPGSAPCRGRSQERLDRVDRDVEIGS